MIPKYEPGQIENKWQEKWAEDRLYQVTEDSSKPKWYALTMFPYTSGNLHIGHWYAMAPSDVHARFKRMQGYNVLHPMGFDAFGLPAENAAIKQNIHPHRWTMENIENMRRQLRTLGAVYDWDREIITCLPEYYKWTQWFFLKLYEAGLAYRGRAPVNWCPRCMTSLANEQVVEEGVCERCETAVDRKDLEQWFFRITRYADELLDHSGIEWPERINTMQKNWIGKSAGVEIVFGLEKDYGTEKEFRVFTTRADTVYGVTFVVFAPEHPLVAKLTTPDRKAAIEEYVARSRQQTEIERLSEAREKDGVFTGAYAINKLNGEQVPIWIADYVLQTYGTGIVMAVPAHDTRDFAFAKKFDLPVKVVISPPAWKGEELSEAWIEPGTMVNSGQFNGLSSEKGLEAITYHIEKQGFGHRTIRYRIRDWLISRQRYWGAPIPMIYCRSCGILPVPEKDLPVLLPPDAEFRPTGESPLKYSESFVNTTCPSCRGPAERETDTMDTFMCSSWYFLRYASPKESKLAFDPEKVKYWLPVDQYMGGAEHANMHLLYARFFTRAIRDMGLVDFGEPFTRLFNQGTIICQQHKMSKSRGNVVNPDPYVAELGADTVRAYLMFVGPWDLGGDWNDSGINGIHRWLNRIWNLVLDDYQQKGETDEGSKRELLRLTHKTVKKVSNDIEKFHYNTMLAALMEFTNFLGDVKDNGTVDSRSYRESLKILLLLLAPSAPHVTEELWGKLDCPYSIHNQTWPSWDQELAADEMITLVFQVNGHLRDKESVSPSITEEEAKNIALEREKVKSYLAGKQVVKVIYVPGRLVNIVAR
ncbi:MAG: leucine--tRNA ligase [Dehalococcoidia bacterium]|nr:leucine--tRNA ligase [Dehalococcoidia bacterium]